MRMLGLRELASGIGILAGSRPTGWVKSRVAGDAMDLALLAAAATGDGSNRGRLAAATSAVAAVTALDTLCSRKLEHGSVTKANAGRVQKSITINRSPEELYSFWHNFEQLPRFMQYLTSVRVIDEKRSYWVADGPAGAEVEWDAEIIVDKPNELIAWRSLEGADVFHSGSVRFQPAPAGRGTIVRVEMNYRPPAGKVGIAVAKVFGKAPEQEIEKDLRRFKQIMETGEIARSEGQPAGGRQKYESELLAR